jgi:hypothetical protein
MVDRMYSVPVYTRLLQFAYAHQQNWNDAVNLGPVKWVNDVIPRVNLGSATGKTTASASFAEHLNDVIVVVPTTDIANNLSRRAPAARVFSLDWLDRVVPHYFDSTGPMFLFDDVAAKDATTVLVKFKPTRFAHLGLW